MWVGYVREVGPAGGVFQYNSVVAARPRFVMLKRFAVATTNASCGLACSKRKVERLYIHISCGQSPLNVQLLLTV